MSTRTLRGILLCTAMFCGMSAAADEFVLSDQCPPSFEKMADGFCELRTLYDFYDSPLEHGGVQANLPALPHRYTPQQIDLGRYLFFDPLLSAEKDMSCASCHQPEKGFSDGRSTSLGAAENGRHQTLKRATPTVWNVAFMKRFMWDGRSDSLPDQALLPLLSDVEMGNTQEQLLADLQASDNYSRLFTQAFGETPNITNLAIALAAFQTSLVSFNSRYDRYAHGDRAALNTQEIEGYNTFRGFVARCSQCHVPPLFSDSELAVVGAPASADGYADPGAGELSDDPFLMGAMRVPTLRNITKTAPYFHSGQFDKLTDVVGFYNNTRGHVAPKSQSLKIHWHVHMTEGPKLSDSDIENISAFLSTLEDETNRPQIPEVLPSGLNTITTLEE